MPPPTYAVTAGICSEVGWSMLRQGEAILSGDLTAAKAEAGSTARVPSRRAAGIVALRGVNFNAITEAQAVRHILDRLNGGHGGVVVTPNLDHLYRCTKDLAFAALVSEADLVVADGMP